MNIGYSPNFCSLKERAIQAAVEPFACKFTRGLSRPVTQYDVIRYSVGEKIGNLANKIFVKPLGNLISGACKAYEKFFS